MVSHNLDCLFVTEETHLHVETGYDKGVRSIPNRKPSAATVMMFPAASPSTVESTKMYSTIF